MAAERISLWSKGVRDRLWQSKWLAGSLSIPENESDSDLFRLGDDNSVSNIAASDILMDVGLVVACLALGEVPARTCVSSCCMSSPVSPPVTGLWWCLTCVIATFSSGGNVGRLLLE